MSCGKQKLYGKTWLAFMSDDLNKPGTYVEIRRATERPSLATHRYLIGDVSPSGGTSDEFAEIELEDIVVSYATMI